jgi:DNA repair protein RadC
MTSNQYKTDCGRFAELVEKFTGIDAHKVSECINSYGGNKLLDFHDRICYSAEQRVKLISLYEAMSLSMQFKHMVPDNMYSLTSPAAVMYYHMNYFAKLPDDRERIIATYVTVNYKVISSVVISEGDLVHANLPLDKLLKDSLLLNAYGVIIAHNHPSGSLEISDLDVMMTDVVSTALSTIGKKLVDSIVVAGGHVTSVWEETTYSYKQLSSLMVAEDCTQLDKKSYEELISKHKENVAMLAGGSHNKTSSERDDR